MELTKEIIVEKIKQNWEKIEDFGVKTLWLFGSYAQDKQNNNSDIDFLVEYKKGRGDLPEEFLGLSLYLKEIFKKEIDIGEKTELKEGFKEYILGGKMIKCQI